MVTIRWATVLLLGLPMVVLVVELGKLMFQQKKKERKEKMKTFCETILDKNKHAFGKHSRISITIIR